MRSRNSMTGYRFLLSDFFLVLRSCSIQKKRKLCLFFIQLFVYLGYLELFLCPFKISIRNPAVEYSRQTSKFFTKYTIRIKQTTAIIIEKMRCALTEFLSDSVAPTSNLLYCAGKLSDIFSKFF